ncbi:MAG: ABC transporter ATP-binding protein [Candidatus Solibacter sp.]|nr:ABC transporter ATP-binding protein [Candidatus Solibacter sp.]
MTAPEIIFDDVSKFYGDVLGVNRVSLHIPPGITSLVGPNGSGKTTLMNLMAGIIRPDRGTLTLRGISPDHPQQLMRIVGYATQYDAAPRGMTGLEFVSMALLLHGFSQAEATRRAWAALDRVSLTDAANRKVGAYSKGMRQRARLAQALAHGPDVLVLDEPLNGLDPLVRAETIAAFREYAAQGRHVILSSHVLQEVDVFSDQVILIANGAIMAEGQIRSVREEMHEHPSQFILHCRDAARVASLLIGDAHVNEVKILDDGAGLLVMTRRRDDLAAALSRIAIAGIEIDAVLPADENVDALYEYLIGGGR